MCISASNAPENAAQDSICLCCCSRTVLTYVQFFCLPHVPHSKASPRPHRLQPALGSGFGYSDPAAELDRHLFQSSRTPPGLQHCSNITDSGSVAVSATSPNSLGNIPSGPIDVCGLKPCKKPKTSPYSTAGGLTHEVLPA